MPATIVLSDDTTDVTLTSGDYGVTAWSPRVPRRRRSQLGGRGPYGEVLEEIQVFIQDTTSSAFLGNINAIRELLDQAERWALGENVDAVKIKYTPASGAQTYRSTIVGVPEDALVWDEEFAKSASATFSIDVMVRFWRAGVWLGAAETESRTASTSFNPGVMTPSSNFSESVALPSPYKWNISLNTPVGAATEGAILFGGNSNRVKLLEGENGTEGTGDFASTADTGASGGNVGRLTPNQTTAYEIQWTISSLSINVRRVGIVINLRNNSGSVTYAIRAQVESAPFGRTVTVDASDTDPRVVIYGLLGTGPERDIDLLELEITPSAASGAGHELDIDTIGVVSLDNSEGRILSFASMGQTTSDPTIDHATLTEPSPVVTDGSGNGETYSGDAHLVSLGNTAAFLVLGNSGSDWNLVDGTSTLLEVGFSMTRRPAFLVPE